MFIKIIGQIWSRTPRPLRLRLIRLTQKKFTASVAAIITNDRDEVLLLDHVLRPYSNWGLPGGFLEHDENPEKAIRRELLEETGIELKDIRFFRIRTLGRHIEILFQARTSDPAEVRSREINSLGWFTPEDLPAGLSRAQGEIIGEIFLERETRRRGDGETGRRGDT